MEPPCMRACVRARYKYAHTTAQTHEKWTGSYLSSGGVSLGFDSPLCLSVPV